MGIIVSYVMCTLPRGGEGSQAEILESAQRLASIVMDFPENPWRFCLEPGLAIQHHYDRWKQLEAK